MACVGGRVRVVRVLLGDNAVLRVGCGVATVYRLIGVYLGPCVVGVLYRGVISRCRGGLAV